MQGVSSKILESCITDYIVDHVFTRNQLVTEYQWAYRKGHSNDLLLARLTETWRRALDSNLVVGVSVFIDFQKALIVLFTSLSTVTGSRGTYLTRYGEYLSEKKIHRCKWRTFRPSPRYFWHPSRLCLGTNTFRPVYRRST